MGTIGRIIGYTLLGALLLPLLALAIMIVVYVSDPRCGKAGDSGGCEMGVAMTTLSAVPVGAAIGRIAGIWKSVRRRP
jgi:hypothetical protein